MIVVDTNVLSEPLRSHPAPQVVAWLARHPDAAVTAISVGEMLRGALQMPAGRRRDRVTSGVESVVSAYARRILAYDLDAARVYAALHGSRRAAGKPLSIEDGMIAATAIVHGASMVATRNVADFEGLGLDVVNPFEIYSP